MVTKLSKVKNVFGETHKLYFEDVKPVELSSDGQLLDINTHFVAISWSSTGGGSVAVLDALSPHRIGLNTPMIRGHTAPIVDVKWSPYKTNILATASDDATVKIWDIPQEGLTSDLKTETQTLSGHSKKVGLINWHPTVFELIASGGFDNKVNVWNVITAESLSSFNLNESIMSLEWNNVGSLLASTTKDKNVNIMDPRGNKVETTFKGHESSKISRVCWIDESHVITTGYGKTNDRQIRLWDLKNTGKEVQTVSIDTQSGPIQPFFDVDTGLIFVPGRGEGNIRYYEYNSGSVKSISEFKSGTSQKSVCFFPKRTMNYNKCEVARIGKLTANTLEYVSFYIPKRVEGFHAEVYPDCITGEINNTVEEWRSGANKLPARKPINTLENKWRTSESNFESKTESRPQTNEVSSNNQNDNSVELNDLRQRCQAFENRVQQLETELAESLRLNQELQARVNQLEGSTQN